MQENLSVFMKNERWQIFVVKRKLMVFRYLQYGKIKL